MIRATIRTHLMIATCVALVSLCSPHNANAQVITYDPSLATEVVDEVSTLSSELKQVTAIAGTVSSVLDIQKDISNGIGTIGAGIDDLGGGTVGQLIGAADLGIQDVQGAAGTAEQISSDIHNLSSDSLSSMSILTQIEAIGQNQNAQIMSTDPAITQEVIDMNNIMSGNVTVPVATQSIENDMYTTSTSPDSGTIEDITATRRAVVQNAAITGMTVAAATSESVSDTGQTALAALSSGVTGSIDERGDIKANSAILLKIAEQVAAQNDVLGRLLYLQSSTAIATQGIYGPGSPQALAPSGVASP